MADREFTFLTGKKITRFCFDYSIFIECFAESLNTTIRIEQEIQFRDNQKLFTISPGKMESVSPLLGLFQEAIEFAEVNEGALSVGFSGNRYLTVAPHSNYEAWELYSNNGLKVICLPGGKLSLWEPIKR